MTISTKKPLYAEVNNVPDDYEFTNEELNRIIAGDMFTPRQDAIMAREIQKLRAAMLNGDEPVSQAYKLPPLSSNEVNDAAWKLHNMLTEHGPLNGRQFNNLKGCFYEAFKVAMRNYPVTPDGWISCSERMPDSNCLYLCWGTYFEGDEPGYIPAYFFVHKTNVWTEWQPVEDDCNPREVIITHWMPLPAAPKQEVKLV
ncbi:DUF551 domain-containing protein [Escherichia coli]|uniref:DUF551 domain-containing protein n=1 Tax=Escherichia coli TaxID=562 RepID=A0AAP8DQC9_ECOLX|nr:DUF551 domain-containing protein [Escherichia coli]EHS0498057.1 DUF551 domain-containing protein [Escherichia coli O26]EFB9216758.1 DUF551 domain-containing protein [Escherichia coli]EFG6483366.1 DUF551 domain-containing protein [Escherichia coli]EFH3608148.1 DUF551 domain-containing protein [Escherichia coli]EGK4161577.1 DUF551 domain-containing protein [Escherichia coli]